MKVSNQKSVSNIRKNFGNGNINGSQNSFGAYSTNDFKEDSVNLAKKAENSIKENWLFSVMRNTFGVENPQKTLVSLGLMIATVVSLAALGNSRKVIDTMTGFGHSIDKKLKNNRIYNFIADGASSIKDSIKNFFLKHSASARDIADTFKNRHARPRWKIAQGTGQGIRTIFRMTPPSIVSTAFQKEAAACTDLKNLLLNLASAKKVLKALAAGTPEYDKALKAFNAAAAAVQAAVTNAGFKNQAKMMTALRKPVLESFQKITGTGKTALDLTQSVLGVKELSNEKFIETVTQGIDKHFNCGGDKAKLFQTLTQMRTGKIGSTDLGEFINVLMEPDLSGKGFFSRQWTRFINFISAWYPVNLINKLIRKIPGHEKSNFGRGNFFDSLIKANIIEGKMADTALGRFVQKSILVPTECISNFVNDKSGMGALLCLSSLKPMYDAIQDAPKGKKIAIAADELGGSVGGWTITTPLAAASAYGLATLGNLKGDTLKTKLLKIPGRFFNMGLDRYAKNGSKIAGGGFTGFLGGAMRAVLIIGIFGSIFGGPVRKAIHKIFGSPDIPADDSNRAAELQRMQEEARRVREQGVNLVDLWSAVKKAEAAQNQNLNKSGDAIGASRLNSGAKQQRAYIPSIAVDNSYAYQEENERNERAARILRSTDAEIARYSRALHG